MVDFLCEKCRFFAGRKVSPDDLSDEMPRDMPQTDFQGLQQCCMYICIYTICTVVYIYICICVYIYICIIYVCICIVVSHIYVVLLLFFLYIYTLFVIMIVIIRSCE